MLSVAMSKLELIATSLLPSLQSPGPEILLT